MDKSSKRLAIWRKFFQERRIELRLSVQETAERSSLDAARIQQFEEGTLELPLLECVQLASGLDIDWDALQARVRKEL